MESFKILALSGGGSKGYLHIGALEILEEKVGNLHEYFKEGIYGCSVGSIIGTAIAFGIPLKKIKELFKSLSFNELFKIDMKVEEIFIKKGIFNMDLFYYIIIYLFYFQANKFFTKRNIQFKICWFIVFTHFSS